jgi:hypothetical protein
MRKSVRGVIAVLSAAAVAACASTGPRKPLQPPAGPAAHGTVSGEVVQDDAQERYAAEPGVTYDQPAALPDNPLPAYPPALLSQALPPQVVTVTLQVDTDGRVTAAMPQDAADPAQAPFQASVHSAVLQWKFFPLVRVRPGGTPTVVTVGDTSTTYPGQATRLPFSQTYRFVFSQIGGKPQVDATSAPAR